ncbi:hypothetical protein PGT21_030878 [Puccinia graminis f. sp. tritici]|uniref:Uncharacterized protein n=1 Tax=Puccinia graminis f. sp. tritici TaxID=56615 RepID=A0A5B0NZY7_PUCGR|nr:hypothetical protein PGT21_030878 [Puccinia graminis f. sp. tritici]
MCFRVRKSNHEPAINRCLEQETITELQSRERCLTDANCAEANVCIKPTPGQNLVVIQTRVFKTGASRTILYRGAKGLLRQEGASYTCCFFCVESDCLLMHSSYLTQSA